MKRCSVRLTVALALCFTVHYAHAKGIFISPGTEANAIGGAFIGIADDVTAIYWNPAGLSQLDRSGAELSAFSVNANATSNKPLSFAEFPAGSIYPTEPSAFSSKELVTSAVLPFAGAYTKVNGFTIAAGMYGVGGGGGKWEDTVSAGVVDTIHALANELTCFTVTNITASKQLCKNCSVGIGLDWVNMSETLTIEKSYTKGTGSGLPPTLQNYDLRLDQNANGSGIQATAGIQYKPCENLRAGVVYRSGAAISLSGNARYIQTGLAPVGMPDATVETAYDKHYAYPQTYGIGVAYDPIKPLTISFGADINNYAALKDNVTYKTQVAGVFANTDTSMKWKDTTQLRIGADYRLNDRLSFQGGIQTDPNPHDYSMLTLLDTNQYNLTSYTVGAGYLIGQVRLHGLIGFSTSESLSQGTQSYDYPLTTYRLAADYTF